MYSMYSTDDSRCPRCGGDIQGDGFTRPFACENAEDTAGIEPDGDVVVLCKEEDN